MEKENLIKETEAELKELKSELIVVSKAIKVCKTSEEREKLFDEKKEIQADIEEAENELKTLIELVAKTPVVEQPTEESNQ